MSYSRRFITYILTRMKLQVRWHYKSTFFLDFLLFYIRRSPCFFVEFLWSLSLWRMTNRRSQSLGKECSSQCLILEDCRVGEQATKRCELFSKLINSSVKTIIFLCELLDFHQCVDKLLLCLEATFAYCNVVSLSLLTILFAVLVRQSLVDAVFSRGTRRRSFKLAMGRGHFLLLIFLRFVVWHDRFLWIIIYRFFLYGYISTLRWFYMMNYWCLWWWIFVAVLVVFGKVLAQVLGACAQCGWIQVRC